MMGNKFVYLAVIVGLAVPALGYSGGAPEDACEDMVPQHHVPPQTGAAPYDITLARKTLRSGDQVQLTITGKDRNDTIKGFLIQAYSGNQRIGNFIVDSDDTYMQTLDCGSQKASAVTHKKHENEPDRRSITATWVTPKDFKGPFNFRATIAKDGGTFWVKTLSQTVKVY